MKTSKTSGVPAVFAKTIQDGTDFAQLINDAVTDLCFLMEQYHGFKFDPYINQEQWCIFISGQPDRVGAQ